jgi:hypothetical protein
VLGAEQPPELVVFSWACLPRTVPAHLCYRLEVLVLIEMVGRLWVVGPEKEEQPAEQDDLGAAEEDLGIVAEGSLVLADQSSQAVVGRMVKSLDLDRMLLEEADHSHGRTVEDHKAGSLAVGSQVEDMVIVDGHAGLEGVEAVVMSSVMQQY